MTTSPELTHKQQLAAANAENLELRKDFAEMKARLSQLERSAVSLAPPAICQQQCARDLQPVLQPIASPAVARHDTVSSATAAAGGDSLGTTLSIASMLFDLLKCCTCRV